MLSHSVDFKAPWELWNPLSKAVPDKFQWSGGQSKHKCLQDLAIFTGQGQIQIYQMEDMPFHIFHLIDLDFT